MPQLLQNIDEIGREKQRDVLFLEFTDRKQPYASNPEREEILAWFDANGIGYMACGGYTNEERMESYRGQVYIDVPYDVGDPAYKQLEAFLENADGSMRWEGTRFICYPLDYCMRNAHHDTPGFWERWAADY
ncbi:hypothetical protein H3H36_15640 [Duganella sp. FT3S]|uniref:Uncharacterized protein n=1 Tax=Rugamonas fusca TaxID=2758568 RepID=A0A7W2EIX9_9BURK|nr:hypothetical protein [Rugamonas fusca]MBA5606789.1 hypothetical protein [Rugamonas fusca]